MVRGLTFDKRPISAEEIAISELIGRFVGSMNAKDLLGIYKALHHEARVEMALHRGRFLSKEEYLAEMQHIWSKVQKVVYRNVVIRMGENQNEATVYFKGARRSAKTADWVVSSRYILCRRNETEWLISESGYIK